MRVDFLFLFHIRISTVRLHHLLASFRRVCPFLLEIQHIWQLHDHSPANIVPQTFLKPLTVSFIPTTTPGSNYPDPISPPCTLFASIATSPIVASLSPVPHDLPTHAVHAYKRLSQSRTRTPSLEPSHSRHIPDPSDDSTSKLREMNSAWQPSTKAL